MILNRWEWRYDDIGDPYVGAGGEISYALNGARQEQLRLPQSESIRQVQIENDYNSDGDIPPSELKMLKTTLDDEEIFNDIEAHYTPKKFHKFHREAIRVETTVRHFFFRYKPTFAEILHLMIMEKKSAACAYIPNKVMRLLFEWWAQELGKASGQDCTMEIGRFNAIDLVRFHCKWKDRIMRVVHKIESDYPYETKWEDATEPTHEEEREWINKISSFENPEESWVDEMEQDPPEEEPQFFTLDPGDKTKERVRELVEEKLNESVLEGRLKEQLKEVVRSRVDAFLTKGDPIERILDH